jgi:hypothetical protein
MCPFFGPRIFQWFSLTVVTFPWWVSLKHLPSCITSELCLMAFSFWTRWIRWDYVSFCLSCWSLVIVWNHFCTNFLLVMRSAKGNELSWAVSCIKIEWIPSVSDTVTVSIFRDLMIETCNSFQNRNAFHLEAADCLRGLHCIDESLKSYSLLYHCFDMFKCLAVSLTCIYMGYRSV